MELQLTNEKYNEKFDVSLEKAENGFIPIINGQPKEISVSAINNNVFRVNRNGSAVNAYVAEDEANYYVRIGGSTITFGKPVDEEMSFEDDGGSSSGREAVTPPMPGSVVKVEVEEGQEVSEGAALIIVEAMKMETTLFASIDGIITKVNVEAGEQVSADTILVMVEKPEE